MNDPLNLCIHKPSFENTHYRKCHDRCLLLDTSDNKTGHPLGKNHGESKTSILIFSNCATSPVRGTETKTEFCITLIELKVPWPCFSHRCHWALRVKPGTHAAWVLCCFSSIDCNNWLSAACRSLRLGAFCPVGGIRAGEQLRQSPIAPQPHLIAMSLRLHSWV